MNVYPMYSFRFNGRMNNYDVCKELWVYSFRFNGRINTYDVCKEWIYLYHVYSFRLKWLYTHSLPDQTRTSIARSAPRWRKRKRSQRTCGRWFCWSRLATPGWTNRMSTSCHMSITPTPNGWREPGCTRCGTITTITWVRWPIVRLHV